MFDLAELKVLAPPDLHSKLVVAGGYLASPEKACDIDLWLLSGAGNIPGSDEYLADIRRALGGIQALYWREGQPAGWTLWEPFINYEESELPEEYSEGKGNLGGKGYRYVGRFQKEGWPKPVQFFVAPYTTPEELLADFDISTHQMACSVDRPVFEGLVLGPHWTPRWTAPRVTNWDTPRTTLARLEKLSNRYGFPLQELPDYARLEALVVNGSYRPAA